MSSISPLAGLRVLDFGSSWAGPFAGMIFADLGADVIRVESGRKVDILRWSAAFADGVRDIERSGWYTSCNRGKRSLALDLKTPQARGIVLDLVEASDVLIENFAPRVMPGLGLDYETLAARNGGLVMASMSGYGATGPQRSYVSYGDHLMYASGLAAQTGLPDDPPTMIGTFYGDPVGGLYATLGILAVLAERDRTGRGAHLDLSQLEGLVAVQPTEFLRASIGETVPRSAGGTGCNAPQGFFRARGADSWVAVAVVDDVQWASLRALLADEGHDPGDHPTLKARRENQGEIEDAINAWMCSRSPWDATKQLQAVGVPAHPLSDAPGMLRDTQLHDRGFFQWVDRAVSGPDIIPGVTMRVAGNGSYVRGPAPLLGEHSEEIIVGLLGRSRDEYRQLAAAGVLA